MPTLELDESERWLALNALAASRERMQTLHDEAPDEWHRQAWARTLERTDALYAKIEEA